MRSVCTTSICFQFSVWMRGICPCALKNWKQSKIEQMLCPEEISIDLIYLTLLCLWALLRPGHGTIRLEWQPLFISPSYWNKWQACSHFHSLCKISAVHFIFLYSSLLSLIFSYAQAFTFSLLPLLSIFITLMHKHSFSFFLLNLSCCLSPTLHILSLALSHARTHARKLAHTALYFTHGCCCWCLSLLGV